MKWEGALDSPRPRRAGASPPHGDPGSGVQGGGGGAGGERLGGLGDCLGGILKKASSPAAQGLWHLVIIAAEAVTIQ